MKGTPEQQDSRRAGKQRQPPQQTTLASLSGIPTELLECICHHLVLLVDDEQAVPAVAALRLSCHAIKDYFYRLAFESMIVENSPSSLSRIVRLSRDDRVAPLAKKLTIRDQETTNLYGYARGRWELKHGTLSEETRVCLQDRMRRADEDYQQRVFVDNSGLDTLKLTEAFKCLPNLQHFAVWPSHRYRCSRIAPSRQLALPKSTTLFFSTIVLCCHAAGNRPKSLTVLRGSEAATDDPQGVEILSLDISRAITRSLKELVSLDLSLDLCTHRKGAGGSPPAVEKLAWTSNLADFLRPKLRELSLRCRVVQQRGVDAQVFKQMTAAVRLPALGRLKLQGFACDGRLLLRFINHHSETLQHLHLVSLNIADLPFSNVLTDIALHLRLSSFTSIQIRQAGHRTRLRSLGEVYVHRYEDREDLAGYLVVVGSRGYGARVAAPQDVAGKLERLARDLEVDDETRWLKEMEKAASLSEWRKYD